VRRSYGERSSQSMRVAIRPHAGRDQIHVDLAARDLEPIRRWAQRWARRTAAKGEAHS
jgi:hypothetical protein